MGTAIATPQSPGKATSTISPRKRIGSPALPGMLRFLGAVARSAREKEGKIRAHIAVRAHRSEKTIASFEKGEPWKALDEMVNAYAEELNMEPQELWTEALRLWRAHPELAETETATAELLEQLDPTRKRADAGKRQSQENSE